MEKKLECQQKKLNQLKKVNNLSEKSLFLFTLLFLVQELNLYDSSFLVLLLLYL